MNDLVKKNKTPMEEEVCKALSEYTKHKVTFEDDVFILNFHNEIHGWGQSFITIKTKDWNNNTSYRISRSLPPKLITMIGRFYEGLDNE